MGKSMKYKEGQTERGYPVQGPTSEDDTVVILVNDNDPYYGAIEVYLTMDDLIKLLEMYTKAEYWE